MSITYSIRFIDDFGGELSKCKFKVTLAGGIDIDVPLLEGLDLIKRFFMSGKISPKEAAVYHRDITRIMRYGKTRSDLMPKIDEFLAICQSHIDLMHKEKVTGGEISANEARAAVGLDPIKEEAPTAKIVKFNEVPLEARMTTFRLPSTMFTCIVDGEKQSYVVINDK